ncbi:hypothetical protein AMTR_s00001p00272940 [Amborella trichopoda]|uniref:Uncharacterized protein n=1 Tax=Amborella trichopoda TaxID=13333 RepID=W1NMI2_AMBTC|nr:hypothetical protein AMTR_s00001p00272940 [Amborella trichopoda]
MAKELAAMGDLELLREQKIGGILCMDNRGYMGPPVGVGLGAKVGDTWCTLTCIKPSTCHIGLKMLINHHNLFHLTKILRTRIGDNVIHRASGEELSEWWSQ